MLVRVMAGGLTTNTLLFGLGIAFHLVMIQPLHTNLATMQQVLADLEKRETSIRGINKEVEQRRADLARLDAAFLNPKEATPFVTLLEAIARQSNVSLSIKSAVIDTDIKQLKQGMFDMTVGGPFANITAFIIQAENIPYFTDISTLTISSVSGEQLQAQLQIRVLTL